MRDTHARQAVRQKVLAAAELPAGTGPWQRDAAGILLADVGAMALALGMASGLFLHPPALPTLANEMISAGLLAATVVVAALAAVAQGRLVRALVALSLLGAGAGAGAHVAGFGGAAPTSFFADVDCAAAELAIAAVPALTLLVTLRRFSNQVARTAVGAVGAAATGLCVLQLTCPAEGQLHALLFHMLPAAAVVAMVLLVRDRIRSHSQVP